MDAYTTVSDGLRRTPTRFHLQCTHVMRKPLFVLYAIILVMDAGEGFLLTQCPTEITRLVRSSSACILLPRASVLKLHM